MSGFFNISMRAVSSERMRCGLLRLDFVGDGGSYPQVIDILCV